MTSSNHHGQATTPGMTRGIEQATNIGCSSPRNTAPPLQKRPFLGEETLTGFAAQRNCVRGVATRSTWLASADPQKTGCGTTDRTADAALVQRLRQGSRERDGQERASRPTASLMGTWPGKHRSGFRVERVNCTSHPAAAMGNAFLGLMA